MNKKLAVLLALLAVAGSLPAQSRATLTDFRLIAESNGGSPDTAIVHSISSGKKHRMEFTGELPGSMNPFGGLPGSVQLMTIADSEWTIDYLDPAKKTYFELRLFEMMKMIKEMTKEFGAAGMDLSAKFKSTGDTTTVDSLGDGGVVMGYKTIHFRSYSAHHWTISVMNDSMSMVLRQTIDSYVAPALKAELGGLDSTNFGPEALKSMMATMTAIMPTGLDSLIGKTAPELERIGRVGVAVKSVTDANTVMMGLAKHEKQTMEIMKIEKRIVPDSVFLVPAGYKKIESPIQMPTLPDSTARTSRSLRTPF